MRRPLWTLLGLALAVGSASPLRAQNEGEQGPPESQNSPPNMGGRPDSPPDSGSGESGGGESNGQEDGAPAHHAHGGGGGAPGSDGGENGDASASDEKPPISISVEPAEGEKKDGAAVPPAPAQPAAKTKPAAKRKRARKPRARAEKKKKAAAAPAASTTPEPGAKKSVSGPPPPPPPPAVPETPVQPENP